MDEQAKWDRGTGYSGFSKTGSSKRCGYCASISTCKDESKKRSLDAFIDSNEQ